MKENPFTLMFGKEPESVVKRRTTIDSIVEEITKKTPSVLAYLISGIRGSGKTVTLREISKRLWELDWIVIDLNPRGNLVRIFAQELFEEGKKRKFYLDWTLSISAPYLSLSIKKENIAVGDDIIARKLFQRAHEQGKRVLVTIDEVTTTNEMRYFANFYQSMVGMGLPLCLLMTGIRENIDSVSSDQAMSFLSRAPKISLAPLSLFDVTIEYARALKIETEVASKLAKATKGYAFAYQVLGYFFCERKKKDVDSDLLKAFSEYLWQNGYDVIWRGVTESEKAFLYAMLDSKAMSSSEIMEKSGMSESNFQNYRKRLLNKGLIISEGWGKLGFALPAFNGFLELTRVIEQA